jgi:hypothetical protein
MIEVARGLARQPPTATLLCDSGLKYPSTDVYRGR